MSLSSTRITLVRHGETIWNREMRLQGSRDIPLSEAGLLQAEQVAARLQGEEHHIVHSSDLQRAHKTAALIAATLRVDHEVHVDLRERSFGKLEGLTRSEITDRYPDFWEPGHKPESGLNVETFDQLRERALRIITEIADRYEGQNVLVISHGGFINAFLHKISEGLYGSGVNKLGNTSITRVIREANGSWTILEIGCTAHLDEHEGKSTL